MRSVVTISRSLGAGGERVATAVADMLGYRYVDEEIVIRAAEKAGVPPAEIGNAEHSAEFQRHVLTLVSSGGLAGNGHEPEAFPRGIEAYRRLIEDVIRETAAEGEVVIVAHAASIPLAGMPGLLRVLVTASPAVRAARLAQHPSMEIERARESVRVSDRERREYLERFYGVEIELPTHYDLVVNTDGVPPALAAHLIVAAARA